VLVDSDLRRPMLHRFLGVPNDEGLTNLLLSGGDHLDGVLKPTRFENLRVLTCGPQPPNPSELLGSRRLGMVLENLKRVADVAIRVQAGYSDDTPVQLRNSPALRALYSNLTMKSAVDEEIASDDARVELALRIDEAVRHVRSDDWRGHLARERSIKRALYDILLDDAEVERVFLIVKAQSEY